MSATMTYRGSEAGFDSAIVLGPASLETTSSIQAAINTAGVGGTVRCRPNQVYTVTSLNVFAGLTIDLNGSTIRQQAGVPNFTRLLTTQNNKYDGAKDSAPLVIRNGTLDGNRDNQGAYTGGQKQQNQLLYLEGASNQPGRLRVELYHLDLINGTGDGIYVRSNVALTWGHIYSRDCWRGAFTLTGGHNVILGEVFRSEDPLGWNVEQTAAGYAGDLSNYFNVDTVTLTGDCQLETLNGADATIANMTAKGLFLTGAATTDTVPLSVFRFIGGRFKGVPDGGADHSRIQLPGDAAFYGTKFIATRDGQPTPQTIYAAPRVYMNISSSAMYGQRLQFHGVDWATALDIAPTDLVYAFREEAINASAAGTNSVEFYGGNVPATFTTAFWMERGGNWTIDGVRCATVLIDWSGTNTTRAADITIANIAIVGTPASFMRQRVTGNAIHKITMRNVQLTEEQAVIVQLSGTLAANTYTGRRTIFVNSNPTGRIGGQLGDIATLKTPVAGAASDWECTAGHASTSAVWKQKAALAA